jgi:hypothetical protein
VCEGVDWFEVAQDSVQRLDLMNTVKKFRVALEADSFLFNRATIILCRRIRLLEGSYIDDVDIHDSVSIYSVVI